MGETFDWWRGLIEAARSGDADRLREQLVGTGERDEVAREAGERAVLAASHNGHADCLEILLGCGYGFSARDDYGRGAVEFGCMAGGAGTRERGRSLVGVAAVGDARPVPYKVSVNSSGRKAAVGVAAAFRRLEAELAAAGIAPRKVLRRTGAARETVGRVWLLPEEVEAVRAATERATREAGFELEPENDGRDIVG